MATDPGVGTPPRKAKGKTPTWYYVAGAVGLVVVYYLYSKSKASSAATTAAATTAAAGTSSGAGTAAGSYGNAGDLAALAPYLNQSNSSSSSGASYTAPTGESLQGSGYWTPNSTTPITGRDNNQYQWISAPAQLQSLVSSGQTTYYQPQPGVFMPVGPNSQLGAATPQYLQIGPASS